MDGKNLKKSTTKKNEIKNLTIGSKIFIVHKNYANQKKEGGKVLPARIISFVNQQGVIKPEFKMTGSSMVLTDNQYNIYTDVKQAINAIKS